MYFRKKKKKRKKLSYRFGPSPWARPARTRSAPRPCGHPARPSPSGRVGHGLHGQDAAAIGLGRARPRPHKGQRRAARPCPRSPPSLHRSAAGRRKPAPPPCPSWRARQPPALTSDFRPTPFVSVAGEHTFAILLISSLRFSSHPSPSCSELRGFNAPGQVPVREKLLSVFLFEG
jgi:hypothetical protein